MITSLKLDLAFWRNKVILAEDFCVDETGQQPPLPAGTTGQITGLPEMETVYLDNSGRITGYTMVVPVCFKPGDRPLSVPLTHLRLAEVLG